MVSEHVSAQSGSDSMAEECSSTPVIPLPDIGHRLSIGPKAFRAILESYPDLLPVQEVNGEKGLAPSHAKLVETIHRLSVQGLATEEIRKHLETASSGETSSGGSVDKQQMEHGTLDQQLLESLRALEERIERSDKQRTEDRDKLILLLLRSQKELQQLRYEIQLGEGRRRKSWWSRLWGR